MQRATIKRLIANIKRHFNLTGDDLLACYGTAIVDLLGNSNDYTDYQLPYVTVSVSPTNWKLLSDRLDLAAQCKHPGSGVPCLFVFDRVYIRAEARVPDADVQWSTNLGCYVPTKQYLMNNLEKVVMAKRSTKKQIEYANGLLKLLNSNTSWSVKID